MTKEHFNQIKWTYGMKAIYSGDEYDVYSCDFTGKTVTLQKPNQPKRRFTVRCEAVEIIGQREISGEKSYVKINGSISDDQWREHGSALFGKDRNKWQYSCPKCKTVLDSYTRCSKCNFTNTEKINPPLVKVEFCGCKIPVFPFYSGE